MQSVAFLVFRNPYKFCYIPVGYIVHVLYLLKELVAVLDNHQLVTTHKPLLLELDSGTDSEIVFDCPFVGAAQNDDFVLSPLCISI